MYSVYPEAAQCETGFLIQSKSVKIKLCLMAHSMSEQHLSVLQVPASLFCVTGASYRDDEWTRTVTTRGRATSQSDTGKRGLMDSNRLWSTPQWIKMTPLSKLVSVILFCFFSPPLNRMPERLVVTLLFQRYVLTTVMRKLIFWQTLSLAGICCLRSMMTEKI